MNEGLSPKDIVDGLTGQQVRAVLLEMLEAVARLDRSGGKDRFVCDLRQACARAEALALGIAA